MWTLYELMGFMKEQSSVIKTGHCQHVFMLPKVIASTLVHRNRMQDMFKAEKGSIVCFRYSTMVKYDNATSKL